MRIRKPYHPNIYVRFGKLAPLLICCFWLACDGQIKTKQTLPTENQSQVSETAININTASAAELEKLPNIGERTAGEIIEHRRKFGRFRRTENLLLVRGISDERFRELKNLVKVE